MTPDDTVSWMAADILVVATPLKPAVEGKCWAFHLVNNSAASIESVIVQAVGYEWGDTGSGVSPQTRFGPIPPATSVEIWRDDDSAAELRMDLRLLIRNAEGGRAIIAEFPKLYRVKTLSPIPILGRDGVVGAVEERPTW